MNAIRLSALRGSTAIRSAAIVIAMAASSTAYAQDDVAGCNALPDPTAREACLERVDPTGIERSGSATAAAGATQGDSIVVTGSRIRRNEFNSPDPITIIDPELAQASGQFSTAEMLQSSPIAAGSAQVTAAISSAFVMDGGVGAETVSLRGLGANRTLVLLNGRRAGPAGTRGAVSSFDLNVLPQTIVKQIEILKTGASSIYGSDAVAGVVNLITKRDTDGFEVDGFSSIPIDGGGEQYRISGTWGKTFDRGHIMATVDYNVRSALKRGDRDYLSCPEEYIFDSTGARTDIIDPRTGKSRCNDTLWGHVWVYDYSFRQAGLYQPDYGQNLAQYIAPNIPTQQASLNSLLGPYAALGVPPGFFKVSHNTAYPLTNEQTRAALAVQNTFHPFMLNETVIPETERFTAFVDASYALTDSLDVGVELLYNKRRTHTDSYRQFYYLTGYTSDFLGLDGNPAPGLQPYLTGDPFSPGWTGSWYLSPTAITDHFDSRIDVDYYRGVAWADGRFGGFLDGWNYNAYVQYSRSEGTYEQDIIFKDAVDLHDFRTASCVGQTLPISGVKCIDVDWTTPDFLAGNLTQAQRDFLFGVDVGKTLYTQLAGELSFAGKLIDLPAGPVQLAFGGTARRDAINDVPGEQTRKGNSWGLTSAGITAGKTDTFEAFGEIEIPLIHDTPLIQEFTLSGSGRVTNVKATRKSDGATNSDNGNWTYSVGANWKVTDWLRFRARYGTSFRAPALFEQFLSNQTSFLTQRQVDPCIQVDTTPGLSAALIANCKAGTATLPPVPGDHSGAGVGALITTGGGLGVLDPETSTAKSASVIFAPRFRFLPNTKIDIAVDYFDIRIAGEIATLSAASIISGCYSSTFFPNEPLCNLFTRVPAGASGQFNIQGVTATYININRQRNEGIDLTINIEQGLGRLGKVAFLGQMSWQFRDEIELFSGTLVDNNGESGEPKWVGDFNLVYSPNDSLSFFYGIEAIGETSDEGDYIALNGGVCRVFRGYGEVCPDLIGEKKLFHSASVTKRFDGFTITAGMSNLLNTKPPRVTVQGSNSLNSGVIATVGQSVLASQYNEGYLGRRAFISVNAEF